MRLWTLALVLLVPLVQAQTLAVEEADLWAFDMEAGDVFGTAVAVSGDTLVVTAPGDDEHCPQIWNCDSGSAYVYRRMAASWVFETKLLASDPAPQDMFGNSVSIDGETVVVGAVMGDNPSGVNAGAAYVFLRTGTTWAQEDKLVPPIVSGNLFGQSVAISGNTAVIGMTNGGSGGGISYPGTAHVFVRSGGNWLWNAELVASDKSDGAEFGGSVAIAGDTIVVGAHMDGAGPCSLNPTCHLGAAYVFARQGTLWVEQQKLVGTSATKFHRFGASVSISGETVFVSAPGGPHFYVFTRAGTAWSQQARIWNFDGVEAVSVSKNTALIGVPNAYHSQSGQFQAGEALVFERSGTSWSKTLELEDPDGSEASQLGRALCVDGPVAVVSAHIADGPPGIDVGRALVFGFPAATGLKYCTAGGSASGCQALMSAYGAPSASEGGGFYLRADSVEGGKDGMFFYGANGRQAIPWGSGYQCVVPPVRRGGLTPGSGSADTCEGTFLQDLNARWTAKPNHNPGGGAVVQAQLWYRDPWNTATNKTTTLSDAIEFTVGL